MNLYQRYPWAVTALFVGALAAGDPSGAEERTISVVGEGRASAVPDRARLSVGVTTSSASAREAAQANRLTMERVLSALVDMGLEEKDMATSNYSIHYERPRPKPEGGEGRYRVSNMLRVN